jgi:hypothetical protein
MRRFCIVGFCFLVVTAAVMPQEEPRSDASLQEIRVPAAEGHHLRDFSPRFRGRALVLDINARVVEENQTVTWNETHRTTTIPGRPVGLKLVGTNLVVAVQFTPYVRKGGTEKFLVAQGQIWMEVPNQGIRYHTSMQTIPLEFNEPIYFFPLGSQKDEDAACIEVMLTLYPYEEE